MPATTPTTWTMSVQEIETLPFDPTPLLSNGQSVVEVVSSLVCLDTQTSITPANPPSSVGNAVTQEISGPVDLVLPGNYRLTIAFRASPSSNVRVLELLIVAVP